MAPAFSPAPVDCDHCLPEVVKRQPDGEEVTLGLVDADGRWGQTPLFRAGQASLLKLRPDAVVTALVAGAGRLPRRIC
jgi:hypothetical protein